MWNPNPYAAGAAKWPQLRAPLERAARGASVRLLLGHDVLDFGTNSTEAVDYPEYIRPAAEAVARGGAERAIVLGGSGNGEAMVANKVRGVRAANCLTAEMAQLAREQGDANRALDACLRALARAGSDEALLGATASLGLIISLTHAAPPTTRPRSA